MILMKVGFVNLTALWVIPSKFLFIIKDITNYYYLFLLSNVYFTFVKIDALFFSLFYNLFSSMVSTKSIESPKTVIQGISRPNFNSRNFTQTNNVSGLNND
jgi:hypothetical protein